MANQIAAGEVINRPSSCVKEMMENSLDAGAENINVRVIGAGKKLIEVADDGAGMSADDMELAFVRHATSKIREISDLNYIETMGFRGEALASIASVARVEMISREKETAEANMLCLEAGRVVKREKTAANAGTIIKVRDLFYNTPARLKFLKSDYTENASITEVVTAIGLSAEGVSIKLELDGREALFLPKAAGLKERIRIIFGNETADSLVNIDKYSDTVKVFGFAAKPQAAKNKRTAQFFFVNKRHITPKRLYYAAQDGYGTLLMKGMYPPVFIFIDINPSAVDVNVHPAKAEVKFRDEGTVYGIIKKAFEEAFSSADLSVNAAPEAAKGYRQAVQSAVEEFLAGEQDRLFDGKEVFVKKGVTIREISSEKREGLLIRALGQVNKTYIVGEDNGSLVLIDQHAAHEKVLYEKIIAGISAGQVPRQEMLIPEIFEVTPSEKIIIDNNLAIFGAAGFEIEQFGERQYRISCHPVIIRNKPAAPFVMEMLKILPEKGGANAGEALKDVAAMMACRAAVKAGDELKDAEIEELLREYFAAEAPYSCPHGRPPIVKVSFDEIERMFKRKL